MITLITMQQFDGHWSLSGELARLLKVPLEQLIQKQPIQVQHFITSFFILTWSQSTTQLVFVYQRHSYNYN